MHGANLTLNLFCATICSFSFSDERFGLFERAGCPVFERGYLSYHSVFKFIFDLRKVFIVYLADIFIACFSFAIKNSYLS